MVVTVIVGPESIVAGADYDLAASSFIEIRLSEFEIMNDRWQVDFKSRSGKVTNLSKCSTVTGARGIALRPGPETCLQGNLNLGGK